MPTNLLARLKTLRFALSCTFKLVVYFSPLLFSTAMCFTAFYLFMLSERQATEEILLAHGAVHVYDGEVNHSIYEDRTGACCFLLRPKLGEDHDDRATTFAGKINVGISNLGVFGEEAASCVVDRLAEGAWDRYFGKSSKWHYVGDPTKECDIIMY